MRRVRKGEIGLVYSLKQDHILRIHCSSSLYTTGNKIRNICKAEWKHLYLSFWFAGNCLLQTTNKYCDFNTALTCSVMDEKGNLQCPKLKIHNRMYRNGSFSNTSPKISHSFQSIHRYIVNLWEFRLCAIIHCSAPWLNPIILHDGRGG